MRYLDVAEARGLPGLRLALTKGAPAPWGEAAKGILSLKGIPYTPVAQYGAQANEALVAWTGHRNAPVAVYENEPPRVGWLDILLLAERLAPDPPLLPADLDQRARVVGLSHEICSEGGFAWSARLLMFEATIRQHGEEACGKTPWWISIATRATPRRRRRAERCKS